MQFKKIKEDILFEGSFKDIDQHTTKEEIQKNNWIPHGFFRKVNEFGDIEFFGCFIDGHLRGKCWKSLAGGKHSQQ